MNKLLVIILVSFCVASVLAKSIKVSDEEDDDENSEDETSDDDEETSDDDDEKSDEEDYSENESDENIAYDVPQISNQFIPTDRKKFIRKSDKTSESEDFYQGDIELCESQGFLEDEDYDDEGGTGWRHEEYRWPKKNGKVIVPYKINEKLYSEEEKANITIGMQIIQNDVGCIKFKERTNEVDFIYITIINKNGCSSKLGKIGKNQTMNLAHRCTSQIGTIVHEFIHALGFTHMQGHTQRDKYVRIVKENIQPLKYEKNFRINSVVNATNFNTAYDYYSIMHYTPYAFSKNKKKTIITLDPEMEKYIGQRNAMSPGDIIRIQRMYNCPVTMSDYVNNNNGNDYANNHDGSDECENEEEEDDDEEEEEEDEDDD